jgi:hypothetical protein
VIQGTAETPIGNEHLSEPFNKEYNNNDRHIPPPSQPEALLPLQAFPVQVAAIPVVAGTTAVPAAIPVVAQSIPTIQQVPADASYYTATPAFVTSPQVQQQPPRVQTPAPPPRINDVIGPAPNFFFLQESELDAPEVVASQPPPVASHIPTAATVVAAPVTLNAPIPTQTFTNQSFAGPPVIPAQVILGCSYSTLCRYCVISL